MKARVSGSNDGATLPGMVQYSWYVRPVIEGSAEPRVLATIAEPVGVPSPGIPIPAIGFWLDPAPSPFEMVSMDISVPAGCDVNWQGCQSVSATASPTSVQIVIEVGYQTIGPTPGQLEGLPLPIVEMVKADGTVVSSTHRTVFPGRGVRPMPEPRAIRPAAATQ